MSYKLKKPFPLEKAVELYKSGLTLKQTALIFGISAPWLYFNLKPLGIVRKAGSCTRGIERPFKSRPDQRTSIFKSCEFCAKQMWVEKNQLDRKRFCSKSCYNQAQISKVTDEEMFWNQVAKTDTCWLFTGHRNKKTGYGSFKPRHNMNTRLPHRFVWELTYGLIPHMLSVLHSCDNKICVRPDHLFLGTQWDNVHDAIKKGLFIFGPNKKLSTEQVRTIRLHNSNNARQLALSYGVSESAIRAIISGRTWKNLPQLQAQLPKGGEGRMVGNHSNSIQG